MEDREMIRRIQNGDQDMFRELILKYYDEIFRYCCYKTGDEQASYDCTQDTFLHLTRYIGTYVEKTKFKAYLFTIARNVCHDYFRSSPAVAHGVSFYEFTGEGPGGTQEKEWDGPGEAVEDEAIRNVETRELLRLMLGRLPDIQREVIILRFMNDFKLREIAGLTGVPLTTVKSRLKQGMAKLKKMMEGVCL